MGRGFEGEGPGLALNTAGACAWAGGLLNLDALPLTPLPPTLPVSSVSKALGVAGCPQACGADPGPGKGASRRPQALGRGHPAMSPS